MVSDDSFVVCAAWVTLSLVLFSFTNERCDPVVLAEW